MTDMYIVEIDDRRYEIALEVAELIKGQGEELEELKTENESYKLQCDMLQKLVRATSKELKESED